MDDFERVRQELQAARAAGLDFDSAWTRSTRLANGGLEALIATRRGWERAYLREPATRAERAVGALAGAELGFELPDDED